MSPLPIRPLLSGLSTFIPGTRFLRSRRTGGTDSARYCYTVWMRHLLMAHGNGLCASVPRVVAELGPGDSIGIGLAALLSGAECYYGFDVVEYASAGNNRKVFEELVALFRNRQAIPDGAEFPLVGPHLENRSFPGRILTEKHLAACLDEERLNAIRESIANVHGDGSLIRYLAPWRGAQVIRRGSVDMVYSQSVLQYVEDLRETYRTLHQWLHPEGFMSHLIDFKWDSAPADMWNRHWTYSDLSWKLIRGKHPAYHTRHPCSTHRQMVEEEGFQLVLERVNETPSRITPRQLARRFAGMTEKDLHTSGAYLLATKSLI